MEILFAGKKITLDENQRQVLKFLEKLAKELSAGKSPSFFGKIFRKIFIGKQAPSIAGLYIYGRVGRGKSMLMNNFFASLPFKNKLYFHFNDFMQAVHKELYQLRSSGQKKALVEEATRNIIRNSAVLCLDEFQ